MQCQKKNLLVYNQHNRKNGIYQHFKTPLQTSVSSYLLNKLIFCVLNNRLAEIKVCSRLVALLVSFYLLVAIAPGWITYPAYPLTSSTLCSQELKKPGLIMSTFWSDKISTGQTHTGHCLACYSQSRPIHEGLPPSVNVWPCVSHWHSLYVSLSSALFGVLLGGPTRHSSQQLLFACVFKICGFALPCSPRKT